MVALVLIGLILACAKLWSDVAMLQSRLATLELGGGGTWAEAPIAEPVGIREPVVAPPSAPEAAPFLEPVSIIQDRRPLIARYALDEVQPDMPVVAEDIHQPTEQADRYQSGGIGFEELFGRKLPIWAGGVTLAVAGFLIVRYSIDAGLLSPLVRVVMGLLFGTALITGAEVALRDEERVGDPRVRQALAGAGVATLYASVLVAANLYHLIAPMTAFVGLAAITALAGGLSLRFGAPSAVLGLVGGLAAPALVGSGAPDVPLLSAYLALAVGGLCALSRTQRWLWLGASALIGGFGWGTTLVLGGALDPAASLSLGAYMLVLGVGLPMFAFDGAAGPAVRLAGSLAACVQLAALVAIGGFGGLQWGLFALISVAIVWLSRREAALADLAAVGLAVALALVAVWPHPDAGGLAMVLAGVAAIYGAPAAWRAWPAPARLSDAGQVAAIAVGVLALLMLHLSLSRHTIAALSLLGAAAAAAVAALGWYCPTRREDGRFAILATTAAALAATAVIAVAPAWLISPVLALTAAALLMLAEKADDPRVEVSSWSFALTALIALVPAVMVDAGRAGGAALDGAPTEAIRWLVPALVAALMAWRARLKTAATVAQPVAVLLGYVGAAQVLPGAALPGLAALLLAGLAVDRRLVAGMAMAAAIVVGWVAMPLVTWLMVGVGAVAGRPALVVDLPAVGDALRRLLLAVVAVAFVASRRPARAIRQAATAIVGVLAIVTAHIVFKQVFAIGDLETFSRLGMAERTVWEMLLGGAAIVVARRRPLIGASLAAAALAHFLVFTALLHDPLWTAQAVGAMPVVNLLLPAYATAFALTWRPLPAGSPPWSNRGRDGVRMVLIALFAATGLRQLAHGSFLAFGPVGAGEDIARSAMLVALAAGFLLHGIRAAARDWRIASLLLMLVAVAKVFLFDAAGLDGLLRIAAFAGLGFSLIGIGWLYSRYLPDASLTSAL